MNGPEIAPAAAPDEVVAATRTNEISQSFPRPAEHDLSWHRADTERLRVLVEFLSRPIHAHGGSEPDPDIITAYNLAVEAALRGIRRAATDRH